MGNKQHPKFRSIVFVVGGGGLVWFLLQSSVKQCSLQAFSPLLMFCLKAMSRHQTKIHSLSAPKGGYKVLETDQFVFLLFLLLQQFLTIVMFFATPKARQGIQTMCDIVCGVDVIQPDQVCPDRGGLCLANVP